jgi:hypothetical protein
LTVSFYAENSAFRPEGAADLRLKVVGVQVFWMLSLIRWGFFLKGVYSVWSTTTLWSFSLKMEIFITLTALELDVLLLLLFLLRFITF